MFCKKCGMKCDSSHAACANCGYPTGEEEYCGGFWGLVGEKPPVPAVRKPVETVDADVAACSTKKVKKQKLNPVFLAAGIILLGAAVIETGLLVKNTKQLKSVTAKYEELEQKYTDLLEEQEQPEESEAVVEEEQPEESEDTAELE